MAISWFQGRFNLKRLLLHTLGVGVLVWGPTTGAYAEMQTDCQVIEIGISFAIPPWVIESEDAGIELDLLRAAFEGSPYCVKPVFLAFALAYQLFDNGDLDGVINAKRGVSQTGFYSDPVVTFQNVAVSLKRKAFPKDLDLTFLQDKSVVAFQKARQLLGADFAALMDGNTAYREVADQSLQLNLLFVREVDFIVMDKSIFAYYWQRARTAPELASYHSQFTQDVDVYALFAPSEYAFVFADKHVRDTFDRGMAALRQN